MTEGRALRRKHKELPACRASRWRDVVLARRDAFRPHAVTDKSVLLNGEQGIGADGIDIALHPVRNAPDRTGGDKERFTDVHRRCNVLIFQ